MNGAALYAEVERLRTEAITMRHSAGELPWETQRALVTRVGTLTEILDLISRDLDGCGCKAGWEE